MKSLKALVIAAIVMVSNEAMAEGYNRVGLSYNYDYYRYNKNFYGNYKDQDPSFGSNGFGIGYLHGFSLSRKLPIYLEVGGDVNFGFKSETETKHLTTIKAEVKYQFQNINLTVPVNFAWKFDVGRDFYISPYIGISGKVNFVTRERKGVVNGNNVIWSDWMNILKKDKNNGISKGDTWRVFQMGGQIGATFGWKHVSLDLQYGGDYIPAYSVLVKGNGVTTRLAVDTSRLKVTLGYNF